MRICTDEQVYSVSGEVTSCVAPTQCRADPLENVIQLLKLLGEESCLPAWPVDCPQCSDYGNCVCWPCHALNWTFRCCRLEFTLEFYLIVCALPVQRIKTSHFQGDERGYSKEKLVFPRDMT
jgi:hypothetical protein